MSCRKTQKLLMKNLGNEWMIVLKHKKMQGPFPRHLQLSICNFKFHWQKHLFRKESLNLNLSTMVFARESRLSQTRASLQYNTATKVSYASLALPFNIKSFLTLLKASNGRKKWRTTLLKKLQLSMKLNIHTGSARTSIAGNTIAPDNTSRSSTHRLLWKQRRK